VQFRSRHASILSAINSVPHCRSADARSVRTSDCAARWHTFVCSKTDIKSGYRAIRMAIDLPLVSNGAGASGTKGGT